MFVCITQSEKSALNKCINLENEKIENSNKTTCCYKSFPDMLLGYLQRHSLLQNEVITKLIQNLKLFYRFLRNVTCQICSPTLVSYQSMGNSVLHRSVKPSRRREGGRSHFSSVPGTMGCFFLDHCCILTTALPLVDRAPLFIETGSCDKQDQHFRPIRGWCNKVTHCQSHFL